MQNQEDHNEKKHVNGDDLGAEIRRRRQLKGLSIQEFADASGICARTVRNIEGGKQPREKTLLLIAEALDVDPLTLQGTEPGPGPLRPMPRHISLAAVIAIAAVVLAATAGFGYWVSRSRATFEVVENTLVARDGLFGRELWSLKWDAGINRILDTPWRPGALLVGLACQAADGGRVLVIDRWDGRILDQMKPDLQAVSDAWGDNVLTDRDGFAVRDLRLIDIDGDEVAELLVGYIHCKNYPFILAVYNQDGRRLGHYASRGHAVEILVEDLDGDGCDEVIASGTNNSSAFQGATLIRLENGFWSGATNDRIAGGSLDVPDSAAARLVLPSFGEPYMSLLGGVRLYAYGTETYRGPDGRTVITTTVAARKTGVIVTCDVDLNLLGVEMTDAFLGEIRAWPNSVTALEGFPSQQWLDAWLAKAQRFEAGHWPQNN